MYSTCNLTYISMYFYTYSYRLTVQFNITIYLSLYIYSTHCTSFFEEYLQVSWWNYLKQSVPSGNTDFLCYSPRQLVYELGLKTCLSNGRIDSEAWHCIAFNYTCIHVNTVQVKYPYIKSTFLQWIVSKSGQ